MGHVNVIMDRGEAIQCFPTHEAEYDLSHDLAIRCAALND